MVTKIDKVADLLDQNENLAYENKQMAKALESLGFTQEQISNICSGGFTPKIVSDEDLKAYAVGLFTSDGEDGGKDYDDLMEGKSELTAWEPFEYWPVEDVAAEVKSTYDSLKQLVTPTLVSSKKIKADSMDLLESNKYRYVEEESTEQKIIVELLDFKTDTNVPFIEVALMTVMKESFLSVSAYSYNKTILDYEKTIHVDEPSCLSYEIDGEYLYIHTHDLSEEIQINVKSQEDDKALVVDICIDDEECERIGYLMEKHFRKEDTDDTHEEEEQWCEYCAMDVEVDDHGNCICCGHPAGQELEKFECPNCGCYFMVEDRDYFVCPNCERIQAEKDESNSIITAYVSGELTGDNETPYRVHIEQDGETKEYECYKTEVLAEERVEYINRLHTSNWSLL